MSAAPGRRPKGAAVTLAEQQQALLDAILHGHASPVVDAGVGLEAYRGNARALAARALAETFPSVVAELGDPDFAAMAWRFWRDHPPERGDLGEWGGALASFLAQHASEASGLPHLARRDWAVSRAERAPDASLEAASLGLLADTPADGIRLRLRPGVTLVDDAVLVWRDGWRGRWQAVEPGEAAFVAAVLRGDSLDAALRSAAVKGIGDESDFDFGAWLQAALQQAWLQAAERL